MASCSLFAPRAFPLISRRELETLIIFQRLAIGVGSTHNITIYQSQNHLSVLNSTEMNQPLKVTCQKYQFYQ